MATAHMPADLRKPSFVGVAPGVKSEKTARPSMGQPIAQYKDHAVKRLSSHHVEPSPHALPTRPVDLTAAASPAVINRVEASFNRLSIASGVPNLTVDGSNAAAVARSQAVVSRVSGSDGSQKADSSSELGTKPPSLDGKSITSGTTFALDEKESLRPDDSASVKAAEDDDSSIRESMIAGSRMGSDLAVRARGIQLGDMPDRRIVQQTAGTHGVVTPQSTSSEQPPGINTQIPLRRSGGSSDALNIIYRQAPDEKLLEALAAPRDRLFLLRLEKDVIDFVQDSKEPYMDLPPSNSFCRMLTHKLADYYHMTHSYEPHIGSVRIFRTPFCRVPPSLANMVPPPTTSTSSTPPPAVLPRKIMRRGQDDEGAVVSAGASKPTSETGSDAKDKQPLASQKLSREEREEMYKLARQRIFGSSEETPSENDGEYGMSRTSSVSATNKSANGRKGKATKPRRDDSDTFDSRRQYTPYWAAQQQIWIPQAPAQYMPPNAAQFNSSPAPAFPPQMGPVYAQQPAGYPSIPGGLPNATYPQYPMPPFASQPAPQRFQAGSSPMTAYGSPILSAAPSQPQNWQPGFNPPAYQGRGPPPNGPPPSGPPPGGPPPNGAPAGQQGAIPYAFGQLPANANPNDPKSQHPIPGSYNRNHAFNPKTQSFVPGGCNMPPQPLQPPFTAPGSHHSSPQIGAPHLAPPFGGHPGAMAPPPYGGGYNMARQGSNTSMAACYTPPHAQHGPPPMQNMQHIPSPQHIPPPPPQNNSVNAHVPSRPGMALGPNQLYSSHLPTYGNPATLPQKPASGI